MAETSYASCGDLSLVYQVFGDRPVELVFVGSMVSHVELFWTMPEFKAFFEQLATFLRVDTETLGIEIRVGADPWPSNCGRRSDRAVEVMARRTPWILRGMARFTQESGRR